MAGQAMLDVQHQQHDQKQYDVNEQELDVGVVGQPEKLVKRHSAVFGTALKARKVGDGTGMPLGAREQPVVEHQTNDFAKPQRHDGQVIAVHSQHREPENAPGHGCRNRRQWQHRPEPRFGY